jgi:D-tyrosyl-tRNA(Tyr) deacylase
MQAKDFYQEFVERVRRDFVADRVKDGIFGAMMNVSLVNDVRLTLRALQRFEMTDSSLVVACVSCS